MNEKYTPKVVKINASENAYYDEQGHLHMDGADYLEGFPDYEWFFATHKDNFPIIYKELSGDPAVQEDIAEVFMSYMEEKGTKVSELMDISKANELEYQFSNWM